MGIVVNETGSLVGAIGNTNEVARVIVFIFNVPIIGIKYSLNAALLVALEPDHHLVIILANTILSELENITIAINDLAESVGATWGFIWSGIALELIDNAVRTFDLIAGWLEWHGREGIR